MKVILFKVISTLNNAMSSGHVALTTFAEAVQSLILAYMTVYFKEDECKKDRKAHQQRMTTKIH